MFAVAVIKTVRHVTCHFDVLYLVAPDRYLVGIEHQNVSPHQYRVHEQTGADIGVGVGACGGIFVDGGLVGVGAVEHTFAQHTG